MSNLFFNQHIENESSIVSIMPELNRICYNETRAGIIHLLVKNKDLNYTSSVEEMSKKLGKRHSVIIHHLEMLAGWKIVDVVKSVEHGSRKRRSIWGLNMNNLPTIQSVYSHMLKTFYTPKDLDGLCCINKNVRKMMALMFLYSAALMVTSSGCATVAELF